MSPNAQIDGAGNIVLQNINGSTVVINPNNSDEVRQLIIDLGAAISQLPKNILQIIKEKQEMPDSVLKGANVYLTVLLSGGRGGFTRSGLRFGVSITNLTKEIRYFNQPFFKVNPPFLLENEVRHDTFALLNEDNNIVFPYRLEYGQPVSVSYPINPNSIPNYIQILGEDGDAYIQCFVSTTVGELYESNQYKISEFFEIFNDLK